MVLLKTLSWAIVSGVIIGTTAYVETQSLKVAFITALVASTLKTPVYSIHEMVWNRVKKAKPDTQPQQETVKLAA